MEVIHFIGAGLAFLCATVFMAFDIHIARLTPNTDGGNEEGKRWTPLIIIRVIISIVTAASAMLCMFNFVTFNFKSTSMLFNDTHFIQTNNTIDFQLNQNENMICI